MENFEVVSAYTRKNAIEDGQQLNTDNLSAGMSKEAGFKHPVYITLSVKKIIDESLRYGFNDLNGVLWDIFTMFRISARKAASNAVKFEVLIYWKNNKYKTFTFYGEIGATDVDNPAPAFTIMTKDEY